MSWKREWRKNIPEIPGETTVIKSYFEDQLIAFVYNLKAVITETKTRCINDFEVCWTKWSLTIDPNTDFVSITLTCESVENGGYCTDVSITTNYGETHFENHCYSPERDNRDWTNKKWIPIDTKPINLNFVLFFRLTDKDTPNLFVCIPWKKNLNFSKAPDIKLKTGESECYINKEVLMESSPVFAAMFLSEMSESKDNSVDMSDFSFDAISLLINFLNYGRINHVTNLEELCILSDMYQIDSLHLACDLNFSCTIDEKNFIQRMVFAGTHRLYLSQQICLHYVKRNYKDAVNSKEWKTLAGIKECMLLVTQSLANKIKIGRWDHRDSQSDSDADDDDGNSYEDEGNCSCYNCNE